MARFEFLDDREMNLLIGRQKAVSAGFYTDWDRTLEPDDFQIAREVRELSVYTANFPFTSSELGRIQEARDRFLTGGYNDDLPPNYQNRPFQPVSPVTDYYTGC